MASENINTIQNELFQDVFKHARIFSFYGHTEHACIAGACEVSDYYHIQSEYGYMELINSKDKYVEKEDEIGEIVATGFNNYVMPLIRYATSDLAVNTNQSCKCGRNYKLIKRLEGRKQEFILDRNNEIITFTNHDETLWDVKDKMSAYQYVQNEPGKVILNIQPKEKLSHLEEYEVEKNFNEYYPNIEIKIAFVKHIKRTKRGKFKYLIQNVKIL